MSTTLNSPANQVFAPFTPSPAGATRPTLQIGSALNRAGAQAWHGMAAAMDVVLDGDLAGAIEGLALVAALGFAAVVTLAAFGVPFGLN